MKRLVIGTVAAMLIAGGAMAARPLHLDWGKHLNPKACDASGRPVIDVTSKVINDADSGEGGNYWALDSFNRHIQVFAQTDGGYCAVVKFDGAKFATFDGAVSPGTGGVLDGDEDGTFEGGYIANIEGTMLANPAWRTRGNVGTINYACNQSGVCPGYIDWVGQYFSYTDFEQPWWGWIYKGGHKSGVWINSIDGNFGDIQ